MFPIQVRSRAGSWSLVILGAAYVMAATVLLAIYVATTWYGRGMVDYVFQIARVCCILGGVALIKIGWQSLGAPPPPPHTRPHGRPEQKSADVRPPRDADGLLRPSGSSEGEKSVEELNPEP